MAAVEVTWTLDIHDTLYRVLLHLLLVSEHSFLDDAPQTYIMSIYHYTDVIFNLYDNLNNSRKEKPPLPPPLPFSPLCLSIYLSLSLSFSPPPLLFFPSVFFSRDLHFLNATLFLLTGPPPHTQDKREAQVSLHVEARLCDFLFDYSSFFSVFRMG